MAVDRVSGSERALLGLLSVGMFFVPAVYALTLWLDGVDYRLSSEARGWIGRIGAVILAGALWIFWRSHADLGRNPLLLQNCIAGWSGLLLFVPLYLSRVPHEEQMMPKRFGEAYRTYMSLTGGVVPRLEGWGA